MLREGKLLALHLSTANPKLVRACDELSTKQEAREYGRRIMLMQRVKCNNKGAKFQKKSRGLETAQIRGTKWVYAILKLHQIRSLVS